MTDDLAAQVATLSARLQRLEDEHEIAQVVASYGPFVDAGADEEVANLWTDDGIYDVDEVYLAGTDQLRAMVRSKGHQQWIKTGCAHFLGPARVHVDGDSAVAVCHSLMIVGNGESFESGGEFVVRRATAHHWEFTRTVDGWRATKRTSRVLDGRDEAHQLLVRGARGETL